jgi:hypothetical protein
MNELFFKTTNGLSEKWLINNHKDYYDIIFNYVLEEDISLSERIYLYQNKLTENPKCLNCKEKVKWIKFSQGYRKFCSKSCAASYTHKDENIKRNRIKNLLICNKDEEMRKEMTLKSINTKKSFSKEKKIEINIKRKKTNFDKYGEESVSKVDYLNKNKSIKISEKIKSNAEFKLKNLIESLKGYNLIEIFKEDIELFCEKCNLNFTIKKYLLHQRKRFKKTICTNCNPTDNKSDFEYQVLNFIKENYNGEIQNNIFFDKKYEIDIYLPDLNIGIECNGLWWHSEVYKDKYYHQEKLDFFNKKDIKILNIWEDDWNFKSEIIKNRILYKLHKLKNKIYSRKCYINIVDNKLSKSFLNDNHIQGYCISSVNIGIFYENELISLITFGKLRKNLGLKSIDRNYELLRFCTKIGYTNIGAFSKLIKFFIKNYNPDRIISYCDASFNDGKTYSENNFNFIKRTKPNYYWFNKDIGLKLNRWNFRKDILVKKGYDKNKTEVEIMNSIGYYRIWDCGSYLYEINI